MERVMIFVDDSNFYHGLKGNRCSTRIDFLKLSQFVAGSKRKLIRTYYYNAAYKQDDNPEKYIEQQKWFTWVKKTPYLTLKLGRLAKRSTKIDKDWLRGQLGDNTADKVIEVFGEDITYYVEKGVDIELASDMLKLAYSDAYDTAILISGDGDFVAAVQEVQDLGKHVENAYFKKGSSVSLSETCDKFISLNVRIIRSCLSEK